MKPFLIRSATALAAATATVLMASVQQPVDAAVVPTVDAQLNDTSYRTGEALVLTLTENVAGARTFTVTDTSGAVWTRTVNTNIGSTFTSTAGRKDGTVTITMTRRSDGARTTSRVAYSIEQWPGHIPGHLILGMSCPEPCAVRDSELGQPYGVRRKFEQWGNWSAVAADIDIDHDAGRLPWVSVKGPGGNAAGWRAVAAGTYDTAIRALATVLKAHDDQPIILTFHHEPSNDASEAEGKDWAAAYSQFHDVLKAEGALANVADAPIVGDFLFNPTNTRQDPADWVTASVLSRAPFLGIDLYENGSGETFAQRVPRILDYIADAGFPDLQVGIGEFGSTDALYPKKSAVQWLNESLSWATANPGKIGVASYFNSTSNSREGAYWPLNESVAKMAAFRSWLDHPVVN